MAASLAELDGDFQNFSGTNACAKRANRFEFDDLKAFTYKRRPVVLVWGEHFDQIIDAIAWERRLKGWSRAKKEAVIRGDWDALPGLSRSRNPRPSTSSG